MPLRYATENGFTDAYRKGQEYGQEQRLREQRLRSGDQEYDIKAEQRPYDLRRVTADTEGAESATRVKVGTEGSDISRAGSQATQVEADARRAGTEADSSQFKYGQDQINAPNIARRIGSEADSAGSNAQRSATQAQESQFDYGQKQKMAPDELRKSKAGADQAEQTARGARATADFALNRRNYDLFDKSMQALANGDIEAAKAYAAQNGQTIPEAVLKDATLQRSMAKLWADAVKAFPNQPRAQLDFLKEAMQQMMTTAGELQYDPMKSVNIPGTRNVPQPPTNTMGVLRAGQKPAGDVDAMISGLRVSPEDQRIINNIKLAATEPAPYGIGSPTVDIQKMGQELVRIGRSDLARMFDPSIQAPGQQPGQPPGAGQGINPTPQPALRPGIAPGPGAALQAPQSGRPQTPPALRGIAQLQWSPQRQVFRDGATGAIYDGQGNRLQ